MEDHEHEDHEHADVTTNIELAGEAIGALLWLVEELAEKSGVTFSDEAADVIDRVDQIAALLR